MQQDDGDEGTQTPPATRRASSRNGTKRLVVKPERQLPKLKNRARQEAQDISDEEFAGMCANKEKQQVTYDG